MLHHPLPHQPVQRPLYQLNTPPVEAYEGYNYAAPIYRPESVNFEDVAMMEDDISMSQDVTVSGSQQPPWMKIDPSAQSNLSLAIACAPPSPVTPLANQTVLRPFGTTIESELSCEEGDFADPMAGVWERRSRNAKKNLDGQVIGYKMGFLADCEKCQMRIPGHSGHFIRKPHSV